MSQRVAVLLDERGAPATFNGRVLSVPLPPPMARTAHVSGNQIDVFHCFAGEERYLTPEGPKTFAETQGTVQKVLTSSRGWHDGEWVDAPIRYYGEQEIWQITLHRNKQRKVIRTTAGHRWIVGRPGAYRSVTTENLREGHRLAHLRMLIRDDVEASREGIRQGVFYGDGSVQNRDYGHRTYGLITLWGEKAKDLAEFFEEVCPSEPTRAERDNGLTGLRFSSGMAGWRKVLPLLNATPEFLRGWLMGYIAADGDVDRHGKVSLSSSVIENLEHVRNVATLLGIGTYGITARLRKGYRDDATLLHTVAFASGDLDTSWLLRQKHRGAFSAVKHGHDRFGWTVGDVEQTDEIAPVYCAEVPDTESFVLEDNIHTGNCPFCGSGAVVARSDMSIECSFCNSAFTVTVSPMYPAFPMSMGGQPYSWPGRPGDDPAMMGGDPAAMGGMPMGDPNYGGSLIPGGGGAPGGGDEDGDGDDDGPPWAKGGDDNDSGNKGDDDDTEAEVGGKKKPPFGKKSSADPMFYWRQNLQRFGYHTADGGLLPQEEYMRHLAIKTARDPNAMAARIKQERRG